MIDTLQELRASIDVFDKEIMGLLAKRMAVVKKVGQYKKEAGIPALDMDRWQRVLHEKLKMAEEFGIDQEMIKDIYNRIHQAALDLEVQS